jgi:hypothetical protein
MPTTLTIPNRAILKTLYDTVISEINRDRGNDQLTTAFYRQTGESVFNANYLALTDAITGNRMMRIVSAPAGGGKTTFSYTFAVALTRYAEVNPNSLYGIVFIVSDRDKAQETYCELYLLAPGKVAVWTTDHDVNCKEPEKVKEPAAVFEKKDLSKYPIAVVTSEFYLDLRTKNVEHARIVTRNDGRGKAVGVTGVRALTVVDEKHKEVTTLEISLPEAEKAREVLIEQHPHIREHMDALLLFMHHYSYEALPNKLFRPGMEIETKKLTADLGWFAKKEAVRLATTSDNAAIRALFAFAKALVLGCAFVTTGALAYFFSYEGRRITDHTAGVVLLDATADLDGVANIVNGRELVEVPKASYGNLEIVHVPKLLHGNNLSKYLEEAQNQRTYVRWMVDVIKQNRAPGELGLVVCKQKLFKAERIPNWPVADPQFKQSETYRENYAWEIEGRKLCAIHRGSGVGKNVWKDARVVFLFDEFFLPRRVSIGETQGYRDHKAHQGDLGAMRTLNSKARGVDNIHEGQVLRTIKQLALRGNARNYDANGVCGSQRVVIASDWKRLRTHVHRMFPGVTDVRTTGNSSDSPTAIRILDYLAKSKDNMVRCADLEDVTAGKQWRYVSANVLTPEFLRSAKELGWKYVAVRGKVGRGKLGTRFEREHEGDPVQSVS